jgi:hypothetical protein
MGNIIPKVLLTISLIFSISYHLSLSARTNLIDVYDNSTDESLVLENTFVSLKLALSAMGTPFALQKLAELSKHNRELLYYEKIQLEEPYAKPNENRAMLKNKIKSYKFQYKNLIIKRNEMANSYAGTESDLKNIEREMDKIKNQIIKAKEKVVSINKHVSLNLDQFKKSNSTYQNNKKKAFKIKQRFLIFQLVLLLDTSSQIYGSVHNKSSGFSGLDELVEFLQITMEDEVYDGLVNLVEQIQEDINNNPGETDIAPYGESDPR